MNLTDARGIADKYLAEQIQPLLVDDGIQVAIIEKATICKPWGWVFFWTDKRAIEPRDPRFDLVGNGPIVVLASDGSVDQLGTARGIEFQISKFEREVVEGGGSS